MLRLFGAVVLACVLSTAANATYRHDSQKAVGCVYDNSGHVTCQGPEKRTTRVASDANGNGVIGSRPHGCPYQFCGCEASLYVFGVIKKRLNLAENWIRDFPRTHPAPGMAAARRHHVMVLIRHVSGRDWLVHDGNSGGHKTREHVRSIVGYVIVDPRAKTAGL